ncbi:3-oxoacyl-[acyl-carrier-protein] synthase III C-terminal domain-containing protein [Phaeobacter gallaeciensis]|uniref:3-oxoacyl-[acyl-carrier-protein] synthase III C-terminal domain-containing protein n=1 Tax=Phaeobacter gallaeciensis TaxID=60890 RepID=UPI000BBBFFE9|nr:3-oxoacyl-[acyl-carrier-protein] synthase III C-terminal domain-containing protein [Phaeobacter gallaeciensis]ATF18579.1 3-oxoacyl-[acyl-carrier-protein] synthase III [Phaeobacter gallaeciensis]ATF22688.1 3-oxoacyl-[acyl-carrier-protein] synthase III [Phaeobacter gallaeciensis]
MLHIVDFELDHPERTETLEAVSDQLSLSRNQQRMFSRFFGFESFHYDEQAPLDQMTSGAIDRLLARNPQSAAALSHVSHCHTLPAITCFEGEHSSILAPFAERGLEVFSATMNHCATGLSMLWAMEQLLGDQDAGLVLIAEKAFHPDVRLIENTTIMGECAAAVLVRREESRLRILNSHTEHEPRFWQNTGHLDEPYLEGFEDMYLDFACRTLSEALQRFGIGMEDVRFILPHNVNMASWIMLAKILGFDRHKICLSTIGRFGHCFGADPFINLMQLIQEDKLASGDRLLLFSIGLGATATCTLVQVN